MSERISHYELGSEIRRGDSGTVYRAIDTRLRREVALTVLPPDLVKDVEERRRFLAEAKAVAQLQHPAIATVHEIDEADDAVFIAAELVGGKPLDQELVGNQPSLKRALELATEIAEGLDYAHGKGVVHRDLEPSNIILTDQGHPKLIDFGIARLVEAEKSPFLAQSGEEESAPRTTREHYLPPTVPYMSPEQARGGRVDHRSDVSASAFCSFTC